METVRQMAPTAEAAAAAAARAHEAKPRAAGRGSGVVPHAELDPAKRRSLFDVMGRAAWAGDLLGRRVDLLTGPIGRARRRDSIQHDGRDVL